MTAPGGVPTALLVGGDLMARARIEQAAAAAGFALTTTVPGNLRNALRGTRADVVILDLDAGGRELVAELDDARSEEVVVGRVVGFFSHVDSDLGAAARAAGCEALPRARFWRTLPDVLRGR